MRRKLSLTVKTDDVTKGRKDLDPHGRFRGEWVNEKMTFITLFKLHVCLETGCHVRNLILCNIIIKAVLYEKFSGPQCSGKFGCPA